MPTEREFDDYINLFRSAAERIFKEEKHSVFRREVDRMTKPLIELPSVREKRLRAEIEALRAEKSTAPIELPSVREKRLQAEIEALRAENKATLAEKDAELARMRELLTKHNITITP